MAHYSPVTMMVGGREVVWWRPVSDHVEAASREPRGEVPMMLAIKDRGDGQKPRSMTLGETLILQKHNWNFTGDERPEHEAAHVVYAIYRWMKDGYPKGGPIPLSYQGTYASEIMVIPLQHAIAAALEGDAEKFKECASPEKFIETVRDVYGRYAPTENLMNTLCDVVGRITKQSPYEIRKDARFSDDMLISVARNLGAHVHIGWKISRSISMWDGYEADFREGLDRLNLKLKRDYSQDRVWIVDAPMEPRLYTSDFGTEIDQDLPDDVTPFLCPNEAAIRAFHADMMPFLTMLKQAVDLKKGGLSLAENAKQRFEKTPPIFDVITTRQILRSFEGLQPKLGPNLAQKQR